VAIGLTRQGGPLCLARKSGHAEHIKPGHEDGHENRHFHQQDRPQQQGCGIFLGLVFAKRTPGAKGLSSFITDYIQTRIKVKPATEEICRQGEKSLLGFFGADRLIGEVTPGDADEYLEHLRGTKLAPMTIRKRLQFARETFA
jgi:hypothetical protein